MVNPNSVLICVKCNSAYFYGDSDAIAPSKFCSKGCEEEADALKEE